MNNSLWVYTKPTVSFPPSKGEKKLEHHPLEESRERVAGKHGAGSQPLCSDKDLVAGVLLQ